MAVLEHPYPRAAQSPSIPRQPERQVVFDILMRGPRRSWIVIAIVLTIVAGMLPVVQTSDTTVTGYQMENLELHHRELESKMHLRESVIASLTALPRVEQEARRIGLEPAANQMYLEVPVPAPTRPHLPARFAPSKTEEPTEKPAGQHKFLQYLPFP